METSILQLAPLSICSWFLFICLWFVLWLCVAGGFVETLKVQLAEQKEEPAWSDLGLDRFSSLPQGR